MGLVRQVRYETTPLEAASRAKIERLRLAGRLATRLEALPHDVLARTNTATNCGG